MSIDDKLQAVREAAEADLETFIKLIHPGRVLGDVHRELINWWTREERSSHQLVLLPRDHQKSAMVAYRVAWTLTKDPTLRILYLSSTANLATKQLKFIKDIFTSKTFQKYWPDHVNPEEGKREKWSETEISLDHPLRKEEAIRDPSIFTAGLTTGIVGLHCDIAVMDDVVTGDNAFTREGRDKVKTQYSFLSSIESAEAEEWVVGTRYFPTDLYFEMIQMKVDNFDKEGNLTNSKPLYEVFERRVEDAGDGTGTFIWPRQLRYDGKPFGFNREILERKRAQYLDKTQFRAQYYNDPNDPSDAPISADKFQYYDRTKLNQRGGYWCYGDKRLNVAAAIDFAWSLTGRADYTSLVVVGMDCDSNIYLLDVYRFKTNKISDYFKYILQAHTKWNLRKLRAEAVAAQAVIIKDLKENYIKPLGLALAIKDHTPTKYHGSKEERMAEVLEPRYENQQIWHYRGGGCQLLEDELTVKRPPHDDVKDSFANAIDELVPPTRGIIGKVFRGKPKLESHSRFGGIL